MKNLRNILASEGLVAASENPTWDRISKAWAKAEAGINKTDRVGYSKVEPEKAYMTYKFMSTFAPHDDKTWEVSAERSRGIILKALKSAGAKIGSVPPMNDFRTKETPFTLDGLPFVFGFDPYRYDMGLYIKPSGSS